MFEAGASIGQCTLYGPAIGSWAFLIRYSFPETVYARIDFKYKLEGELTMVQFRKVQKVTVSLNSHGI